MKLENLFSPIRIGKRQIKNRIVMAPMGANFEAVDGGVTEALIDYFEERARGEIGDVNRFASSDKLAKCAGIAPQQKSSGKKQSFKKSNRGRRQLNTAIYRIALCQIGCDRSGKPKNSKARDYFLRKISEGKTKKEALTCLQRRLCDIIYAMMKNKTEYRFNRTVNSAV